MAGTAATPLIIYGSAPRARPGPHQRLFSSMACGERCLILDWLLANGRVMQTTAAGCAAGGAALLRKRPCLGPLGRPYAALMQCVGT